MNRLTTMDYIRILDFYELKIPLNQEGKNNRQKIKQMAEDILATKLCRCIKKVRAKQNNKKDESRPIAICKQSIFKNRNLNISRFTCKKNLVC